MSHFQHFFVLPKHVLDDKFYLEGEEFDHAIRVMRKKVGDSVCAADGEGKLYRGSVVKIQKQRLVAAIEYVDQNIGEPEFELTLAFAPLKGSRVDTIVEKGTEIGIAAFQPILTQHTMTRMTSRPDRWRQKAIAAMKQCGRSRCPQICETIPFRAAIEMYSNELKFIAHEKQHGPATPFADWSSLNRRAALFVGPEGGFSEDELEHAVESGARLINLGSRRLRSDTACLVGAIKLLDKAAELGRE